MDNKLKYAIKVIDKVSLQKSRAKQKVNLILISYYHK